ncbi:glucagon-like peptide 2 receptor [Erinaceus europaeus]|uniref:Glucagon-like peptide 2 receptor n=1 Tax=Erinaceus europaeus TaxID=9365 RepID=A0ABM3YH73_ERIEU|nr:glucagon-like peptide 2 receptor [Erinaceus europaeus]
MRLGRSRAGFARRQTGPQPGVHPKLTGTPAALGTKSVPFHRKLSLCAPARPFLILLLLVSIQQVTGSLLEKTVQKWSQYRENCLRDLRNEASGVFCNGTFDQYVCWPHSSPGDVSVPCPDYLPGWTEESSGRVHRHCLAGGIWQTLENSTVIWQDDSECSEKHNFKEDEKRRDLLSTLQLLYTVGYSLSLVSLCLALTLLLLFRKLHCTRNYIHMNLFASFILRALAVLMKDVVIHKSYSKRPNHVDGWMSYMPEMATSCRALYVLQHYFVGTNYSWLLVEGLYLNSLLEPTLLSERWLWPRYLLLGWAFPGLYVVPWSIARSFLEDTGCWGTNGNMKIWWIIRGPLMLCVAVNLFIFMKILKLVISKLKAHQMGFGDYKCRLAKSALVLIPLLGVHELAFTFILDDYTFGISRHLRLFFQLTLSSFHGFLVALLYCFANGEVKAELWKHWARPSGFRAWLLEKHFQFLGKCPKRLSKGDGTETLQKLRPLPGIGPLLLMTVQGPGGRGARPPRGHSLSESSEGDFTLAHTMEEILEESEI